jgi:hypothetical protein
MAQEDHISTAETVQLYTLNQALLHHLFPTVSPFQVVLAELVEARATISLLGATISLLGATISLLEATISQLEATIFQLEATIFQRDATIERVVTERDVSYRFAARAIEERNTIRGQLGTANARIEYLEQLLGMRG